MNQQSPKHQTPPGTFTKQNTPLPVKVIALITLSGGLFLSLLAVPAIMFGPVALLMAVQGLVLIVTAIGLRRMKKWALYVFLAAVLWWLYVESFEHLVFAFLGVVAAIYLWSIRHHFT